MSFYHAIDSASEIKFMEGYHPADREKALELVQGLEQLKRTWAEYDRQCRRVCFTPTSFPSEEDAWELEEVWPPGSPSSMHKDLWSPEEWIRWKETRENQQTQWLMQWKAFEPRMEALAEEEKKRERDLEGDLGPGVLPRQDARRLYYRLAFTILQCPDPVLWGATLRTWSHGGHVFNELCNGKAWANLCKAAISRDFYTRQERGNKECLWGSQDGQESEPFCLSAPSTDRAQESTVSAIESIPWSRQEGVDRRAWRMILAYEQKAQTVQTQILIPQGKEEPGLGEVFLNEDDQKNCLREWLLRNDEESVRVFNPLWSVAWEALEWDVLYFGALSSSVIHNELNPLKSGLAQRHPYPWDENTTPRLIEWLMRVLAEASDDLLKQYARWMKEFNPLGKPLEASFPDSWGLLAGYSSRQQAIIQEEEARWHAQKECEQYQSMLQVLPTKERQTSPDVSSSFRL